VHVNPCIILIEFERDKEIGKMVMNHIVVKLHFKRSKRWKDELYCNKIPLIWKTLKASTFKPSLVLKTKDKHV